MQNVGVLLFFLISGFLITYTLIERSTDPSYGFWQFCIERSARIYSGLIPALALIVVIDGITIYLTGDPTISRYFTFKTMIANVFMLEGYRGVYPNVLQWSAFGSASPLWTLAIEWHIYIFVASVFFVVKRPRSIPFLIPFALFFGQTPIHFLLGSFQQDGVGKGLFTLWLAGSLVYLVGRPTVVGYLAAIAISVCSVIAYIALTHAAAEYSFTTYPLLLAAFFGLIAASQTGHLFTSPRIRSAIKFMADYSFSLYLVHHTIMYAMWTIFPARGTMMFIAAVVISNVVAMVLAEAGEKHHRKIAKALSRRLLGQQGRAVLAP